MYRYKIWTACDFIAKMTSFKKKNVAVTFSQNEFFEGKQEFEKAMASHLGWSQKKNKKTVFCTESHYLGDHLLVISFCTEGHFWALRWSPKKMSSLESHHFPRLIYQIKNKSILFLSVPKLKDLSEIYFFWGGANWNLGGLPPCSPWLCSCWWRYYNDVMNSGRGFLKKFGEHQLAYHIWCFHEF